MRSDLVKHHWLWNETLTRLRSYQRRVDEGKDLDGACEFARYVIWSGLADVLKPHDNQGLLKVDSGFLMWTAKELQRACQDAWALGKVVPRGEQAQLDVITHKLDLIAGELAKRGQSQRQEVPTQPPQLVLVTGGANVA